MTLGSIHNAYPNGRPSGLPTDIVDQLVQARKQQRLQPINQDIQEINDKKDLYTSMNQTLRQVYEAADQLGSSSSFQQYIAGAQDESVATAEATGTAQRGEYNLQVDNLAQAQHQLLGVDDADAGTGVTQGVSDPDNAALLSSGAQISFYHQGEEYSHTVQDDTSLNDLAENINQEDNDVAAQVLNLGTDDNPQHVLSLKSESTGSDSNRITTDQDGTTPGLNIDTSGSADGSLFLDSDGNTLNHEQDTAQSGQDATLFLDGAKLTRSSNQITDAIQGVTLDLKAEGETQVAVAQDREGVSKMVQGFVDAFNKFDSFLEKHASYDQEEQEGGPLMGDSLVRSAKSQLRDIINDPVAGTVDDPYQYLSQVGVESQRDGTLSFDQEKFDQAMAENPQAVEKLFTSENGVGKELSSMLQRFTSSSGNINNSIDNLNNRLDRLEDERESEYESLQQYQERQVRRFTDLEQAVMKYQSMEQELKSVFDSWDSSSKD